MPNHPIFNASVYILDSKIGAVYIDVPLPVESSKVPSIAREQGYILSEDWIGLDVLHSDIPRHLIDKYWKHDFDELVSWVDYEELAELIYKAEYGRNQK